MNINEQTLTTQTYHQEEPHPYEPQAHETL